MKHLSFLFLRTEHTRLVLYVLFFCIALCTRMEAQVWMPISGLPISVGLKTVHFIDLTTGWVAGENGTIMKTGDGGTIWTVQPSGINNTLRSIFFLDATNGWACGDGGTILVTTNGGVSWDPQTSPYSSQYNTIRFANTTTGWLVGAGNVLLATTNGGTTWTQQQNQGVSMWGLEVLSPTSGWACGGFNNGQGSPTLLKTTNGITWSYQNNSGVTIFTSFNDVCFADANNGWLVGGNGIIRHTLDAGTTTWSGQSSGTQAELLCIDDVNASIGYACGRDGIIITTQNGGTSWAAQSSSITSGTLWEIDMINDTTGFAVGDTGILKYQVYTPTQPIDLLQPTVGGDIFQIGSKRFIIWQTQTGINNVKLEYSTTGNSGPWITIINSTPAAHGSYSWNVPNTSSINCFIRISNTQNSGILDISDAPFYILNTPYGIDYSVLTSAQVNHDPPEISILWASDANALSYTIDKKLPNDLSWTNLASLSGSTNSYTDNAVLTGTIYEYRVVKTTPLITGYGYVYTGINIPATEARGTMLLAVDENFISPLQPELEQYTHDLIADGWKVILQEFPATTIDTTLKNWVIEEYFKPGATVKALLIIGHFAIPYSGNFAPNGHAERIGAQPADVFYADIDGDWTDNTVITTTSGFIHTPNDTSDGRWDQSVIPSPVEIQVGRIDMHSMNGFALSEVDLLKQYLNKNHAYRYKIINPDRKALLNPHLDSGLPRTSAVAWRSFAPMVGSTNITMVNTSGCSGSGLCATFVDSLQAHSYLWTYMAGGGTDTSCANPVFTSSHCINLNLNTIFMQLYGSYFVEWAKGGITGTKNHLLRAPLANAGMPLTTCWTGGGPRWYFHHMGLGETIGFSTMQSQNNTDIYDPGTNQLLGGVHMVLMGDPSLRLHVVYPVTSLTATQIETTVHINWTASIDSDIIGYNVYQADSITGTFHKLNDSILISTAYVDSFPSLAATNVYMVRAVKAEIIPSGSYQNMSEGIFMTKQVVTTFTFSGNGVWSDVDNWNNNLKPPVALPAGFTVVIDPVPGGQCLLDVNQHIANGATFVILSGALFDIMEDLFLH